MALTKNKVDKKTPKNKKKIIITSVLISLVVVIGGCLLGLAIWREQTKPVLIDELTFEINSEITNASLLLDGYEIIDEENIKTDELGEHEYTIKYRKGGREKELAFSYFIVDTTPPEITVDDIIEITEGEEVNLASKAAVKDNSKEDIKLKVEGEYDIAVVGEYNLKFVAEDSSKNKTEKDVKIFVKEETRKETNDSSNNNKTQSKNNTNNTNNSNNSNIQYYQNTQQNNCQQRQLYTFVDENTWRTDTCNHIRKITYFWYIMGAETVNDEVVDVFWNVSCDSGMGMPAIEMAKSRMPAHPTGQQAIDLYKNNRDIRYGNTVLYTVIP